MTPEEIDNLQAGRDLDALIAEHVFGWVWTFGGNPYDLTVPVTRHVSDPDIFTNCSFNWDGKADIPIDNQLGMFPEYSTDIAAAWLILEKLAELDKLGAFSTATDFLTPWQWLDYSRAADMALFICKTALKALIGYDPDLHGRNAEPHQQIQPGPGVFESQRTYATWQRFEQMLKDRLAAQQQE